MRVVVALPRRWISCQGGVPPDSSVEVAALVRFIRCWLLGLLLGSLLRLALG